VTCGSRRHSPRQGRQEPRPTSALPPLGYDSTIIDELADICASGRKGSAMRMLLVAAVLFGALSGASTEALAQEGDSGAGETGWVRSSAGWTRQRT
jgi:hypothetical protein